MTSPPPLSAARVVVTWGPGWPGAEAIGRIVAGALQEAGHATAALPCGEAGPVLPAFDAVIVGGTLRSGRWPLRLRWFVRRRAAQLRRVPVWFFSDGPLDASADREQVAPSVPVFALMSVAGARGHATFCSRLLLDDRAPTPEGHGGDRRSRDRILAWARQVARELPPVPAPGAGAVPP